MISTLRARFGLIDHLVRTYQRYQADNGDRLAAAVTFYWFLSLFPILLLVIYLFKLVNGASAAADVQSGLAGYLPPELVTTISTTIGAHAGRAGLLGAVGLLLSGLGWIDALREAIRAIWRCPAPRRNLVVRKVVDVVALIGLLATVTASVIVTGLAGSGPQFLLEQAGVESTTAAIWFTKALGLLLAGVADVALFLYLFVRLAGVPAPFWQVLKGAVFGAVGFGLLKLVGGFYVQHTTKRGEATYGAFAVVIGLLLFLNLVSRLVLYAAAFAVTASPEEPETPEEGDVVETPKDDSGASPVAAGGQPPGAPKVQLAARVTVVVGGMVLVMVMLHALKTVQRLLRR
ncbi:MAG: putative integral rane protein [Frankiales bacterium]|nr:putative integral rane protein [Frankiales bacterium]